MVSVSFRLQAFQVILILVSIVMTGRFIFSNRYKDSPLETRQLGEITSFRALPKMTNETIAHVADDNQNRTNEEPLSCKNPEPDSYPVGMPDSFAPEEIQKYAAWHKRARACLMDASCKEKPRVLIVTCPGIQRCLGLGDRMRGLTFASLWAMAIHRAIFIDWGKPFPIQAGFAPSAIDWTLPPTVRVTNTTPHEVWTFCGPGFVCRGSERDLRNMTGYGVKGQMNFYEDDIEATLNHHDVIAITPRFHYHSSVYLSKNPFTKDRFGEIANSSAALGRLRRSMLRSLFQPSAATNRRMKEISYAEGEDYVSVHIRTGRDVAETFLDRFKSISGDEMKTVQNIIGCIERNNYGRKVFLASDSTISKSLFTEEATKRGIEVRTFEEKAIHYEKTYGLNRTKEELCNGFVTVFADVMMLARGKMIIRTTGHFSGMAMSLSLPNTTMISSECESEGKV